MTVRLVCDPRDRARCGLTSGVALVTALVLSIVTSGPAFSHDALTFERDVQPILQMSCGGTTCHIGRSTSGVELTSHETTLASIGARYRSLVVIPGNPDLSPLMDKIASMKPQFGVRMPRAGDPLGDREINTIRRWIKDGAAGQHISQHGDANGDDVLDLADAIFILNYLFAGGQAPACAALADADGNGSTNISDAVFVLRHLFAAAAAPGRLEKAEEEACEKAPELTFATIYEKVFATSCAFSACHSTASHKGGLALGSFDEAYESLVGVESANESARARGLLRISPGDPDRSFLLRKLMGPGPGEGDRMPASSPEPLPGFVIDAVGEWILAGAPRDEAIAGVPDLGDVPPPSLGEIQQPPVPEHGIQLHLPPFSIGPGTEREIFFFVGQPFANLGVDEVFVQRIDIHMLESSHHFIIYEYVSGSDPRAGVRPLENVIGLLSSRRFVIGSQQSFFSIGFPEGVGLRFTKDTRFDLNSHYLNFNGEATLRGEVYVNIFFADPGSVQTLVKPIFEINPFIKVPPFQTRTTEWRFPGPVSFQYDPSLGSSLGRAAREIHIYALSSHTHRHGIGFDAFVTRNGRDFDPPQRVYHNLDWDDPVNVVFETPLVLEPGDGLRFTTTHEYHDPPGPTSPPLTFDVSSEDEMAILLGFYSTP